MLSNFLVDGDRSDEMLRYLHSTLPTNLPTKLPNTKPNISLEETSVVRANHIHFVVSHCRLLLIGIGISLLVHCQCNRYISF